MEAFDQSIAVKEAIPTTTIKMEAAERPFEGANTVADSGVIVKREKLSPIRIVSKYYFSCSIIHLLFIHGE